MTTNYLKSSSARWLLSLGALWALAWVWILSRPAIVLPLAPPDHWRFLIGEAVVGATILLLVWLSRKQQSSVSLFEPSAYRHPRAEALGAILYLVALILVGQWFGVRSHIASLGLTSETLVMWRAQTPESVLIWAAYYGIFGALVPFAFFRFLLGYSARSLLLAWPKPAKRWIVYAAVTGLIGVLGFTSAEYFRTSIAGHLATLIVFTAGTFLPVMVLTQSILAPRLAAIGGSIMAGAVLTGAVYALYHLSEFFLSWNSPEAIVTSLAWLAQFALFGFYKGITTLRTGSAWTHIFNTHLPHLAEAPAMALCLGIK